jgi:hypothetical protein
MVYLMTMILLFLMMIATSVCLDEEVGSVCSKSKQLVDKYNVKRGLMIGMG